ncbi:DUF4402 domain-containing protein [Salinimicrobium soli]|uniref:DUF4402 domain-containing protein n=1 Tax=Salinimicrobium soli TaxID=1254399 RepID=UPI003AADF824
MKNIILLLFLFFGCLVARSQATATFTASATIIEPIGISTTSNMSFAHLEAGSGGSVILSPEDQRFTTGDVHLAAGGEVSAAAFEVTGQQGFSFSISLPEQDFILSNGSDQLILKNFTSNLQEKGFLPGGVAQVKVGATLEVKGRQLPGNYTSQAPMAVTVNYN